MTESLVQKSDIQSQAKHKMLMAKVYIVLTIVAIIVSMLASIIVVQTRSQDTVDIARVVSENRDFISAIKELDTEIERVKQKEVPYDLATFLPPEEQFTDLTRQFDQLFSSWNTLAEPMVNNSLSFGRASQDEDRGVSVLPITLNLTSSLSNFERFLYTIEASGLPGSDLRLMDIQSVAISLATADEENNTISYSVNLNAYFQL